MEPEERERQRKVLVMGYGSIGRRHTRNLNSMGIRPYVLTRHPDGSGATFIREIGELGEVPLDCCIIASPTSRHRDDLALCAGLSPRVLVEKPLEATLERGKEMQEMARDHGLTVHIGYNLRFLDAFPAILGFLRKNRRSIRMVSIQAGQHLSEWRPSSDYRDSYSASRARGGGVDLDLSHEVDYALWLFGKDYRKRVVVRERISDLEIDAPDYCKVLLTYGTMVVDITVDYIRRPRERTLRILCEDGSHLACDFIANTLTTNGVQQSLRITSDQSYSEMLRAVLGMPGSRPECLCTLSEGLAVLETLEV